MSIPGDGVEGTEAWGGKAMNGKVCSLDCEKAPVNEHTVSDESRPPHKELGLILGQWKPVKSVKQGS